MGLTQQDVAQLAGVKNWKVSDAETGRRQGPRTIKKIADALEIDMKSLLKGYES